MTTRPYPSPAATTRHRLAWLCALLMFVVAIASAFMRHHADVVGQIVSADQIAAVRQLHRVAATLVLLGAIALVVLARRAGDRTAVALSSALLGTAGLLSVVGIAAGASRAAPVVLVNLLGGHAMLALSACLAMARPAASHAAAMRAAARWLLVLLVLQAAAGGWAGSNASTRCIVLDGCTWLPMVHRIGGLLVGNAVLLFGLMASLAGRRSGMALALLALLSMLSGMVAAAVGSLSVPAVVVGHNACAALTIALLVCLARR